MKRHFQLLLGLILCIPPLQCATLERLSFSDIIGKSTAIVRAKVTGSYTALAGPVIFTHYKITVLEQFKGSKTVEFAVPGGISEGRTQFFAGSPQFQPGDEYVFFLWTGKSGLTQVIGLTQGLFAVGQDGADPSVTRAASHELMLDGGTGRPVKDETLVMRLSELRARIRGAAK